MEQEPHNAGYVAYDAYREFLCGPCVAQCVYGNHLPSWSALPKLVREAWGVAGLAIKTYYENESQQKAVSAAIQAVKTQPEPED